VMTVAWGHESRSGGQEEKNDMGEESGQESDQAGPIG
jgi:hypothetical protein